MENENISQPLDALMTQLGVTNADLVNASTEQLSFKMVQKGRKGRRLSTNIQDKILTALLKVKPDLKSRRRDLFRYEIGEDVVEQITSAISDVREKKIKYPKFVDRLVQAGINRYAVEVAANQTTFYGAGGEAHIMQGPVISPDGPGRYGEASLRSAISDAQKMVIDHAVFLKRIYAAGIVSYEVNTRERKIVYRGIEQSYKETIPLFDLNAAGESPKPSEKIVEKTAKTVKVPKKKKLVKVSNSVKARKAAKGLKRHRMKKRK